MRCSFTLLLAVAAFACSDATLTTSPTAPPGPSDVEPPESDAGSETDARPADSDGGRPNTDPGPKGHLRVMAANITSGPNSSYDSGEGIRIFKGLHPDLALIQEFNFKTNTKDELDAFVADTFGADYSYVREDNLAIPNGVISRYPILTSGRWADPQVDNRGFAYAKIDIPGPHDLWAVSVHLLTSSSTARAPETVALVAQLKAVMSPDDFVVIGGDFNTKVRGEQCVTTLGQIVDITAALPVDQNNNNFTNAPRSEPYDWLLASTGLGAFQVPTTIGGNEFPNGLVFDSRVYTPLTDVAPVLKTDSDAQNMQHMPVVKDFAFE